VHLQRGKPFVQWSAAYQQHQDSVAARASPTREDVGRLVIDPLFRVTPKAAQKGEEALLQILILGEANICRSPVAEALLRQELSNRGIADVVGCASKSVQDFTVGEGVPESVRQACRDAELPEVPSDHAARMWRPEWDVCDFDLIVAVDRYVAADAMKEVSVWDTIQKEVEYCAKIRGLYEFGRSGKEIQDPLYGNVGGEEELASIRSSFVDLQDAIRGLAEALASAVQEARAQADPVGKEALQAAVGEMLTSMGAFDWDAPPMLRKRQRPTGLGLSDGLLDISDIP